MPEARLLLLLLLLAPPAELDQLLQGGGDAPEQLQRLLGEGRRSGASARTARDGVGRQHTTNFKELRSVSAAHKQRKGSVHTASCSSSFGPLRARVTAATAAWGSCAGAAY